MDTKIKVIQEYIKNEEYDTAEKEVLKFIEEEEQKWPIKTEDNKKPMCFDSFPEFLIYKELNKEESIINIFPLLLDLYSFLSYIYKIKGQKEKFEEIANRSSRFSIVFSSLIKVEYLMSVNRYEEAKQILDDIFVYIGTISYLTKRQIYLMKYYVHKKEFKVADAIYTVSEILPSLQELTTILKNEDSTYEIKKLSNEEAYKILDENHINVKLSLQSKQILETYLFIMIADNDINNLVDEIAIFLTDSTGDLQYVFSYMHTLTDMNFNITIEYPCFFDFKNIDKSTYEFNYKNQNPIIFQKIGTLNDNYSFGKFVDDIINKLIEDEFFVNSILQEVNEEKEEYTILATSPHHKETLCLRYINIFKDIYMFKFFTYAKNIKEVSTTDEFILTTKIHRNKTTKLETIINNINNIFYEEGLSPNLVQAACSGANIIIKKFPQDVFWQNSSEHLLEILMMSNAINKTLTVQDLMEQIEDPDKVHNIIQKHINKMFLPGLEANMKIVDSFQANPNSKVYKSILEIIKESLQEAMK